MKATLDGTVLAESGDIISAAGYDYFPATTVHTELLEKSPRTAKAGPGFAKPDFKLSVEWLDTRNRLQGANLFGR